MEVGPSTWLGLFENLIPWNQFLTLCVSDVIAGALEGGTSVSHPDVVTFKPNHDGRTMPDECPFRLFLVVPSPVKDLIPELESGHCLPGASVVVRLS